jgi:two-component system, chemotaxis family, sensor kinase CheA
MDISRYRDLFVSEAREHLTALGSLSMRCEGESAEGGTIHELFRHAHSLKGMAATMQLVPMTSLAHALEDLLSQVRDGRFTITRTVADLMLGAIDTLEQMVELVAQGGELPDTEELANRIRTYVPTIEPEPASVLLQQPPPEPVKESVDFSFRSSDDTTTRIRTSLLDRLVTLSGELLTVRHTFEDWAIKNQAESLNLPLKVLSKLLRQLQTEVFQARMLPFGAIAERYPRMVRDLARKSGKEITFQIQGDSIELDRGVLEQVTEPLVHLLRNAVDHGLETPAERVARGKPPVGRLSLSVTRHSDQVLVEITDDGRGMEPSRIRAKALAQGIVTEQQAAQLALEETLQLVCTPGFSTAATVTEVSGRGVGMDVVQSTIHCLGGSLVIHSTPGRGSTFALRIPLSVAIIHALMVTCGELLLAVPVSVVTSTCEVQRQDIIQKGRDLLLVHKGQEIPLRNLPSFFRQRETLPETGLLPVLLTESGDQTVALLIDRLIGQQELFTRPLRPPLSELRGISGSCLLGNGQIVFVVDPVACTNRLTMEH